MNTISDAIDAVKAKYPTATQGRFSTRTADLFDKLEGKKEEERSCCFEMK